MRHFTLPGKQTWGQYETLHFTKASRHGDSMRHVTLLYQGKQTWRQYETLHFTKASRNGDSMRHFTLPRQGDMQTV
ncbi:hypothetical protein Bpfe_022784 [Biomphalaria pfeifferi]|uniref:Uncharacterized protein n=1 Tax=Biomphalaria pfeifferi TaxID=112525 RepID=A0AAD8B478_BIOPF|nr:hypothetical protein Bpfe_022784 [Biomphalaria pfeifferi]